MVGWGEKGAETGEGVGGDWRQAWRQGVGEEGVAVGGRGRRVVAGLAAGLVAGRGRPLAGREGVGGHATRAEVTRDFQRWNLEKRPVGRGSGHDSNRSPSSSVPTVSYLISIHL